MAWALGAVAGLVGLDLPLGTGVARSASGQTITTVAPISGGSFVKASGVNANGNAVAGYSDDINSADRAIRWTNPGGSVSMGLLPGGVFNSYAVAIDATGTILAGYGDSGSSRAFRWTTGGGYQLLPVAPGASPSNFNQAFGISQSGAIVVGTAGTSSGARAFLWNSASPASSQNLGVLSGQSSSGAAAVSGNGSTVVGSSGPFAFRWTSGGGMVSLGSLPGQVWALGEAVNTDGTAITGRYNNGSEFGYRWTQATGMVALPKLSPTTGALRPRAISGDGKLIIGQVVDTSGVPGGNGIFGCFVWTPVMGTQPLATHLAARGVNLTGWQLSDATGISADGRAMCGLGIFNGVPQGWVVKDLPCATVNGLGWAGPTCVGSSGWTIANVQAVVAGAVYRWEKNGVPLTDGLQPWGSTITGTTTNTITFSNIQIFDAGDYTLFMSSQGACESSFTGVNFSGPQFPVSISVQPTPNTACVGQNPGLFCAATTPFNTVLYRWQKFVSGNWVDLFDGPSGNGGSYFGAATTTFSILNAQVADTALYRCRLTNSSCTSFPSVNSDAVQFTINGSPTVTAPPIVYSCAGDVDAFIGVSVAGNNTYQWQKFVGPTQTSWVDIFDGPTGNGSFYGQTNSASLGIYAFTTSDAGLYRCRVTGPCGPAVNSAAIQVLSVPPAAVLANPVDTTQCIGDNDAFFSVTATPGAGYRWQKSIGPGPNDFVSIFDGPTGNGGNYGGTSTANFGVFGVYPGDFIRYRCVIIDACFSPNAISAPASLLNVPDPVITSGPVSTPGCFLGTGSLSVTATPAGSTYQWQKKNPIFVNVYNNIANGPTGTGSTYAGVQTSTLQIVGLNAADTAGEYRCIVFGPCGNTPAVSTAATFFLQSSPALQTQPVGGNVCISGSKTLSVAIAPGNYGTVTYQWWRFVPSAPIFAQVGNGGLPSGASASGANSPTLTLTNFQAADGGQYYCRVTGACDSVISNTVTLTAIPCCGPSDIAGPGPSVGPDGELTADDVILFINWFTNGNPLADIAGPGPSVGPDGEFTADDVILFIGWFSAGC
jgi:probable HAF family extracellular repeat protein